MGCTMTVDEWAQALLEAGGWPVTVEKRIGIVAWALAEGDIAVPRCSGARWNPLDTTEPAPGASNFNPQGVRDYPDEATGISATVATLHDGYYDSTILPVLADEGASAQSLAAAVGASPWGTGNFARAVEQVASDTAAYFAVVVPGSPPGGAEPPAGGEPAAAAVPTSVPPAEPAAAEGDTMAFLCQQPGQPGVWVVAGDLARKQALVSAADEQALAAAGYQRVELSAEQLADIPTVTP